MTGLTKADFEKWNNEYDFEGMKKDVEEIEKNGGTGFEEVPDGEYEVIMTDLKMGKGGENSNNPGGPVVRATFKIIEGEYKNRLIFMNHSIAKPYTFHKCNEFLRGFELDLDICIMKPNEYNELLMDIAEEMDGVEFLLHKFKEKNYPKFEVLEIYE